MKHMVEQLATKPSSTDMVVHSRARLNKALARLENALLHYQQRQVGHRTELVKELDDYIQLLGNIIHHYDHQ